MLRSQGSAASAEIFKPWRAIPVHPVLTSCCNREGGDGGKVKYSALRRALATVHKSAVRTFNGASRFVDLLISAAALDQAGKGKPWLPAILTTTTLACICGLTLTAKTRCFCNCNSVILSKTERRFVAGRSLTTLLLSACVHNHVSDVARNDTKSTTHVHMQSTELRYAGEPVRFEVSPAHSGARPAFKKFGTFLRAGVTSLAFDALVSIQSPL